MERPVSASMRLVSPTRVELRAAWASTRPAARRKTAAALHTGEQFVDLDIGHAEVEGCTEALEVDAVARRHHPSLRHPAACGKRRSYHSPVTTSRRCSSA